jgi:hypothetical protein
VVEVHARALKLAIHALSLACVAAALGSSGCYIGCDTPWRHPGEREFGSDIEPIAVGEGVGFTYHVALGRGGEIGIVKIDGETTVVRPPGSAPLLAVTRLGPRLVAVGESGAILVSDDGGATWSPRASGTTRHLRAIVAWPNHDWDSHPNRLIAVGDDVVLTSVDGEAWTIADEPEGGWGTLHAAVGTESQIWLVGERGVAWSHDPNRGTWIREPLGTDADLLGVSEGHWGTSRYDLMIVASKTSLFLRSPGETSWRAVTPEIDGEILGLSGGFLLTSTGRVFAVLVSGELEPVPIEIDFVPTAIHGQRDLVVVVGRGGRAAELAYLPCKGRPLLDANACVVAATIERDDWQIAASSTSDTLDEREASRWRRAGLDEHASVASFAVHVLELISLGAPAELVLEVQRAMADEVRHAALSFDLARRFSGIAHGPGALKIGPSLAARRGDAQAIALALFEQGGVGETLAACEADVDARTCADPTARAVLEVIAEDERRHAALAWSTLRWLLDRDPALGDALLGRLRELARATRPQIHAATMRELVVPLTERLLAQ